MNVVGERMKEIRVNARYSQRQIAEKCGTTQASIGRYETGLVDPPFEKLLWYADFFEVSLDYIFGRTDNPQGMLYQQNADVLKKSFSEAEDLDRFAELCFEPGSKLNQKLKSALKQMIKEVNEEE